MAVGLRNSTVQVTLHHFLHFKRVLLCHTKPGASQGLAPGQGLVAPTPSRVGLGAAGRDGGQQSGSSLEALKEVPEGMGRVSCN